MDATSSIVARPKVDHVGLMFMSALIVVLSALAGLFAGVVHIFGPGNAVPRMMHFISGALGHLPIFSIFLDESPFPSSLFPFIIIGAGAGAALSALIYKKEHARQSNPIRHISGPKLLSGPAGAKVLQRQIRKNFIVNGIKIHPNVQTSQRLEIQHFMLIGATGGGKTTVLWQLLDQIVQRKDKVILYDVKSDFTQKLAKRIVLAPWDKRSRRWLIGKDITSEALAQAFAECFILPNPRATDPVWDNAARALLRCEIHKLIAEKSTHWTFSDLGKGLEADLLVGVDDPKENMEALQKFVRTYYPEAYQIVRDATSKATASVLFTQAGQLSPLIDICKLDGELAKLNKKGFWLDQDSNGFLSDDVEVIDPVILKRAGDSETWSRTFFSAFVNVAALKINGLGDKDPEKRRIWFILDEVPQLGKIPQATQFLETGRSKGVRMVLGLQNPEQIDKIYGKEDRATWENNTVTKIWFQDVGKDAKRWASESVGSRTVQIFGETNTHGTLPPSSGQSNTWGDPREKRLLEEHGFEMILRPKPKLKIVTELLQIAGFDRVVLDWPMISREIIDQKEKDPVALPPRQSPGGGSGGPPGIESSPSPAPGGGGGDEKKQEEATEKKETKHDSIQVVVQPEKEKKNEEKEGESEDSAAKLAEKMLNFDSSELSGETLTDSLKLLAEMLDSSSSKSGSVGKIDIAKSTTSNENENEEEDERC